LQNGEVTDLTRDLKHGSVHRLCQVTEEKDTLFFFPFIVAIAIFLFEI